MLEIKGLVESKIFSNEESGFGIYRIALLEENNKSFVVKGTFNNLELDSTYLFSGEYEEHYNYGLQFNVKKYEEILPSEEEHVLRYLSGPSFPGIGIKSAQAIVDKYGVDILNDIKENSDLVLEVKGVSKDKLENVCTVIRDQSPLDEAITILLSSGFSSKQVVLVTKEYEENSLKVIQNNPYQLMIDINGIGFRTVDKLGRFLEVPKDDPARLQALILDQYEQIAYRRGDSFIYMEEFLDRLDASFYPYASEALASLIDAGILVLDEERLYHHTQYNAEVYVSDFLKNFEYSGHEFDLPEFEEVFNEVQADLGIDFDESQIDAIQEFLANDVMILTGGPGTGKSTLLSGIVRLLQKSCPWLHITLCAPTGRAAKRLTELTNVHAATVHSVLKWEPNGNTFGQNENNPLETDILIIDEFSMVDIWLASNLFKAARDVKKVLFVGDKDQLPSVSPGFVLGDMIASKRIKTLFLERNYRQEEGSEVVDLAIKVKNGHFDLEGYHEDVRFFDSRYGPIDEIVGKVVAEALLKGYSLYDVQVLAPKYEGKAGINRLNTVLQSAFNPKDIKKHEITVGNKIFREGDKILQLKNQPEDMVFNGDVGELISVDPHKLTVNFDGNFVEYDPVDFINITHAYCMSVHKAQGSEYPIVVLIADRSYGIMLSRRLYYTGLSRSSKTLILVGDYESFKKATANQNESHRYTFLKQRLESK